MNYDNLPTDDLKEFGIIGADNTFSKKLSNDDIQKFLKGESLVADNGKDRVVFQLKDENTRLEVNVFQRDRAISDILNEAEKGISYSSIEKKNSANDILGFEKKAFMYDEKLNQIVEFDSLKRICKTVRRVLHSDLGVLCMAKITEIGSVFLQLHLKVE